jgi:hypothetical protein
LSADAVDAAVELVESSSPVPGDGHPDGRHEPKNQLS